MTELDPSKPNADHLAMQSFWRTVDDILAGADAMRAGKERYLPRFEKESDANYKLRCETSPFRGEYDENDPASDHAKIRLAAKYGYTSTDDPHRGKGLPVVREAIRHCRRGRLHILSRFGEYVEESGQKPTSRVLNHPVPGTLIVWELWL